jgi:hypothetical protein
MAVKVKCVNRCCSATRHHDEGKLFRLDLDLGSRSGDGEHMTEYIWLCADCAQRMHPTVEVGADKVTVRLSANPPLPVADASAAQLRARLN